jgi:hypothetical protein
LLPRRYLSDLFGLAEPLGGFLGVLMILFSIPGIFALVSPGEWARGLPWLPVAIGVLSSLLLVLGLILLWQAFRGVLRFSPLARLWSRHRR